VLRGIFGHTREEGGAGWRRLHNEELHILYVLSNIIRVIKWKMRCAGYGTLNEIDEKYVHILVGKLEEMRPFGRPRMDIGEVVCDINIDWSHLTQEMGQ